MAENGGTDRTSGEPNKIGSERRKCRRKRRLIGKKQLAEDEAGGGAVKEEIVPLDRSTDRRCDDSLAELRAVFCLGQHPISRRCHSHGVPPDRFLAERASVRPVSWKNDTSGCCWWL